ncbi:MAG: hypothetical protein COA78_37970 [Blastopirellula sp.]|nr:MAG: hypothetical protein COA78_37970 [Blastopirellula sp.]
MTTRTDISKENFIIVGLQKLDDIQIDKSKIRVNSISLSRFKSPNDKASHSTNAVAAGNLKT